MLSENNYARLLLLPLIFCLFVSTSKAQTIAYYYTQSADTIFYLPQQQQLKTINNYFPSYGEHPLLQQGIVIPANSRFNIKKVSNSDSLAQLTFFTRYKAENIRWVRFLLISSHDTLTIKDVELQSDGTQILSTQSLDKVKETFRKGPSTLLIDYEPADVTKQSRLISGDIWIGNVSYQKRVSPASYFQQAPFINKTLFSERSLSRFDSYNVYTHFPNNESEEDFKGSLLLEDSSTNTIQLLNQVMQSLVSNYPFYEERALDKSAVLKDFSALIKTKRLNSLCELVDTLNNFLHTRIQDPHFFIRSSCHPEVRRTPIYTYNLNDKNLVAAVLDKELVTKIPLGAEVLSINDQFDTKDIDNLLKKKVNDSVWIKLKNGNDSPYTVGYRIKSNYVIPKAYKPSSLDFKFINDSTAYYKINHIYADLPVNFLNRVDSINRVKRLILDLRGNGGGDFMAAAQFLTFFTPKPLTYFHTINKSNGKRDSVIVSSIRHQSAYREDGHVLILIDNNTVCVAELLAKSLKSSYPHVTIVGKEASRGALAFTQELRLPHDNISIVTNSMNTIKIQFNNSSIEGVGIIPDEQVRIESIQDLQPYNDKVLITAISK
jgi:C-terminal processing protease CtpA/Prc